VKLELDIARMRRDLAEKDNIIEEKAEEMYMLNEKLEQQVRKFGCLQYTWYYVTVVPLLIRPCHL
jgi:hypothetical protein